ncbi:sensor histidine kinase [Ruminococcaceae bacterium OttesenSCG-928-A16]|nr:sensor histidine kinase [Ruminococcaceae bacterium OttesenSCG-928-A16]
MQPKTKQKNKKSPSLQWSLVFLILGCWVLPIMLTVGFSGYLNSQKTYAHVSDIVTFSVENATDIVKRDIESTIGEMLNASYVPDIRSAYTTYEREAKTAQDPAQKALSLVTLRNSIQTFLTRSYSRNSMIHASYILFPSVPEKDFYAYNAGTTSFTSSLAFYQNGAAQQALNLMPGLGSDIAFIQQDEHLYAVRMLTVVENKFNPYAILAVEVNLAPLYESLQNLPTLTDVTLYLNDIPLVAYGNALEPMEKAAEATQPQQTNLGDGQLLVYGSLPSTRFSLQYYAHGNLQPLLKEMSGSTYIIVFLALLVIPLIALVFLFFYRKVTLPIDTLTQFAGIIEEGDFGAQIHPQGLGSREFAHLGGQMNNMSARLESQFERIYREELALRDARIKALQSQINPHFLGNTLEIINWEARLAGNVKVSQMLEALSTMLEAVLDRRHRPLIHLSEEMMYVNSYLYIIGERLGKRLEIRQELDPALLDWYVPRLILQPIVENAVEHGVNPHTMGVITIRATPTSNNWMLLEVENNNAMTPEDEENVRKLLENDLPPENDTARNIGIRNVHQRLRIIYGPKSGLSIKTTKSGHTISSMCIRHLQEPQDNTR